MVFWKKNNEKLKSDNNVETNKKENIITKKINKSSKIEESESHFNKSVQLYKDEEYDEALIEINKAILIDPNNPYYYYHKSSILSIIKEYYKAIKEIDKAISIDDDNPDYHYQKGSMLSMVEEYYDAVKEYYDAMKEYYELVSIDPDNPYYHYRISFILYLIKEYDKALMEIDKAISIDPEDADYYYHKSSILSNIEEYDEALIEIDKAISIDPDNLDYHESKGLLLSDSGEIDDAIKELEKAISIDPDNPDYHEDLGSILGQAGKYNEAIEEYDKALKLLGYSPEQKISDNGPEKRIIADVIFNKAGILEKSGKIKGAINIYYSVWQIDPKRLSAPIRICNLYYNSGKYKEAKEIMGEFFTYDLKEIKDQCESGNCETSDLINCLEIVIKSCQKINKTKYLDTYVNRLLELDPENKLAKSLKK